MLAHPGVLKRLLYLLYFVLISITFYTLTKSAYNHLKLSKLQSNYRQTSTLIGFNSERLEKFPLQLSNNFDFNSLRNHSVSTNFTIPACRLSEFHQSRYQPLLTTSKPRINIFKSKALNQPRSNLNYFIAINLINAEKVLPSIINTLLDVITSLGVSRFHASIYENGSQDSTILQLYVFSKLLDILNVGYTIISDQESEGQVEGSRINRLAKIRNKALANLFDSPSGTYDRVIFLNDIIFCPSDLLELLFQQEVQSADLSCAMDYKELTIKEFEGNYPQMFYDTWIARDMQGQHFYKIEKGGNWALPSNPLQYSLSKRIAIYKSSLFTSPLSLRFRSHENTDEQSECYLICSDMWKSLVPWDASGKINAIPFSKENDLEARGARIQIIPRSSVAYNVEDYEKVRKDNLTTVEVEAGQEVVDWEVFPPKLVASYPYARWSEEKWITPF